MRFEKLENPTAAANTSKRIRTAGRILLFIVFLPTDYAGPSSFFDPGGH